MKNEKMDVKRVRSLEDKLINDNSLPSNHPAFQPSKKAFTLAEILITLGVIGVVSAITMPTLIQNHTKHVVETRLKKSYSTLSQAVKLSEVDNDSLSNIEGVHYELDDDGNYDTDKNLEWMDAYVTKYIMPYVKYVKKIKGTHIKEDNYYGKNSLDATITLYLADGTSMSFHRGGAVDVFIDINGEKNPNEFGKDVFTFLIKDRITAFCSSTCDKKPATCACSIYQNNWKIPDDYPYAVKY